MKLSALLCSLLLLQGVVASLNDPRTVVLGAYEQSGEQQHHYGGDTSKVITLWPDKVVPGERVGVFGNETFRPGDGGADDRIFTNVTLPTLTPFLVHGATSAVVIAPGGGYSILAFDREGTDIARWLNSIGISAFVLKYRVPARPWLAFGEAPLMDAQRAMGIVRSRASEFMLNATKIGFMGFSAGGHLTAHISTVYAKRIYSRVDAEDDVSCRPDFSLLIYPWEVVSSDLKTLVMNVTKQTPVAFLSQAEDDGVHCENSIEYFLGMKRAQAPPSELHVWPSGGHGYGRCTVYPKQFVPACGWPDRATTFLQRLHYAPQSAAIQLDSASRVLLL